MFAETEQSVSLTETFVERKPKKSPGKELRVSLPNPPVTCDPLARNSQVTFHQRLNKINGGTCTGYAFQRLFIIPFGAHASALPQFHWVRSITYAFDFFPVFFNVTLLLPKGTLA